MTVSAPTAPMAADREAKYPASGARPERGVGRGRLGGEVDHAVEGLDGPPGLAGGQRRDGPRRVVRVAMANGIPNRVGGRPVRSGSPDPALRDGSPSRWRMLAGSAGSRDAVGRGRIVLCRSTIRQGAGDRRRGRSESRSETESAMLNGVSGMIGETAVVTKAVSDRHQPGSVFTRGETWYAVSLFPGTTIDEPAPRWWWPTWSVACWWSTPPTSLTDRLRGPDPSDGDSHRAGSAYSGDQEVVPMIIGSVGSVDRAGGGGCRHLRPHRGLPEVVPEGGPAGMRGGGQAVRRVQDHLPARPPRAACRWPTGWTRWTCASSPAPATSRR